MKKILIPVNETKGSQVAVSKFIDLTPGWRSENIVLLYVEKYNASFLMDEMLGESELSALREALEGTGYQEALDRKAEKVLDKYKKTLEEKGIEHVEVMIKVGHPPEEILQAAKEIEADMIVMGSRGKRFSPFMMGSVSREVANNCEIPVLLIK